MLALPTLKSETVYVCAPTGVNQPKTALAGALTRRSIPLVRMESAASDAPLDASATG